MIPLTLPVIASWCLILMALAIVPALLVLAAVAGPKPDLDREADIEDWLRQLRDEQEAGR